MSESRYVREMVKINGRPALINVTEHPSGTRYFDLKSIEYLDSEFTPELRAKLERLYAETQTPTTRPVDEYRSPARPIFALLAVLACITCAVVGADAFGTNPLTLAPMLAGIAWWAASIALGRYAYKTIRAALR